MQVELGGSIRKARGTRSQTELAAAVGTDQPTISKWENGERRPELEEIAAIEDACGLPRGWILRTAGYVAPAKSVLEVLRVDPALDDVSREMLIEAYRAATRRRKRKP